MNEPAGKAFVSENASERTAQTAKPLQWCGFTALETAFAPCARPDGGVRITWTAYWDDRHVRLLR